MRTPISIALALFALSSLGCENDPAFDDGSAPVSLGKADTAAAEPPVITFGADWSVTQSGPLVAGGRVRLRYDVERMPRCRTWYRGFPAWGISYYLRADDGSVTTQPITQLDTLQQKNIIMEPILAVPVARELSLWFHASDEGGCQEWDSDYGRNFHLAITNPTPSLTFKSDWTVTTAGTLRAGGDVLIGYDLARLPNCRAGYNGYQTWNVLVRYRIDGGQVSEAPLTEVVGMYGRQAAPARIVLPAGARELELWFQNNDRSGCVAYDSNYGQNFKYRLN